MLMIHLNVGIIYEYTCVWRGCVNQCMLHVMGVNLSLHRVAVELPTSLFVGLLSQFQPLLDSVSAVRGCTTPFCRGK